MATTNARILSAALLFLACAPLPSLYAILVPSHVFPGSFFYFSPPHALPTKNKVTAPPTETEAGAAVPASKPLSSLQAILQDPDSTLEELWAALFREGRGSSVMPASLPAMQVHHWTIILPWCISLILGVIVPFLLELTNYLRPEDNDDEEVDDEYPWGSRYRRNKKRLKKLAGKIKDYRKVLEESDVDPDDCDAEGVPRWRLPFPGERRGTATRKVDGICAVCLGMYVCGEEVLWSSNAKCPHVYHEDCLLSWLVRRRKQCPCCRQPFLVKTA